MISPTNSNLKLLMLLFLVGLLGSCASRKLRVKNSIDQIDELKENVLLVRLKSTKSTSEKKQAKLAAQNEHIMQSFKDHYDFSTLYFFYAFDSPQLKAGEWEKVNLFDREGRAINANQLANKAYLIAEFGYTYDDQMIYEDAEGNRRMAAGTNGKKALIVLDKDYIQLGKPFPSIEHDYGPEARAQSVKNLNNTFHQYYLSAQRKKFKKAYRKYYN